MPKWLCTMVCTLLIRRCLVTGLLLLAIGASHALTLGRTRGAVLIGQPLNVDVLLALATDESVSALCLEADVFHADTLVSASKVSVATVAAGAGQAVLRIRSQALVDEPFVILFVRAGCAEKVTRRYVLLADVVNDASSPGVTIAPAVVPALVAPPIALPLTPPLTASASAAPQPGLPRAAVATKPSVVAQAAGASAAAPVPATVPRRRSAKPASVTPRATETARLVAQKTAPSAAAQSRPRSTTAKAKQIPNPPTARLVIDPLELVAERNPVLKLSPEMLSTPTENVQQRAATAALWRALNTQPLDLLRDLERIERLEAQANTVRIQNTQQQERIAALSGQLQKAQAERYDNPLIYALYSLLGLALAGSGYFWWRSRRAVMSDPAWWLAQKNQPAADDGWTPSRPASPAVEASVAKPQSAKPQARPEAAGLQRKAPNEPVVAGASGDLDLDLSKPALRTRARAGLSRPQLEAVASAAAASDFGHSQPGRAVNAEELIDVQQQADFFVSLGQYDQAINVLKDHIKDSVQTSAVAYLDLLQIYHSIDRRVDYSLLRDEFQKVFNAHAPKFADFGVRTRGLESYFVAMARIQALWPSPKVLDVIEESIFRKPGEADGEAFDLEAYRDLILLHTLVKTLMEDDKSDGGRVARSSDTRASPELPGIGAQRSSNAMPSGFVSTDIQPLPATADQAPPKPTEAEPEMAPDLFKPPASMRLGLDFDLSKLDSLGPAAAPEPGLVPSATFHGDLAGEPLAFEHVAERSKQADLPDNPSA